MIFGILGLGLMLGLAFGAQKGQEAIFTETYTKSVRGHPSCLPQNIGLTTTYKLENY